MLTDPVDAEAETPATLLEAYLTALETVLDGRDVETAAEKTDVDTETLTTIQQQDAESVTLEDATEILALPADSLDAEARRLELRDHIMLLMSSAVMDVEALETGLGGALDARELQQKIEGRSPMTLEEYARIHHYLASETP